MKMTNCISFVALAVLLATVWSQSTFHESDNATALQALQIENENLKHQISVVGDQLRERERQLRRLEQAQSKLSCLADCRYANCSVEVKAYSAHTTPCGSTTIREGYVKLNGEVVWRGSWCGDYPNHRGVNIVLVDPFSCSMKQLILTDTHVSSGQATALSNYLLQVDHGSVIVGATSDEPRQRLDNALATLRQLRVEVSDVQSRGSFAFVVQKGFPSKTVLRKALTEAESFTNQPLVKATITGASVDELVIN